MGSYKIAKDLRKRFYDQARSEIFHGIFRLDNSCLHDLVSDFELNYKYPLLNMKLITVSILHLKLSQNQNQNLLVKSKFVRRVINPIPYRFPLQFSSYSWFMFIKTIKLQFVRPKARFSKTHFGQFFEFFR
jgi:hypothetical protein